MANKVVLNELQVDLILKNKRLKTDLGVFIFDAEKIKLLRKLLKSKRYIGNRT